MGHKEIVVKNHVILVDADDYPFLSRYSWHVRASKKTFYAQTTVYINGKYKTLRMHRLIMGMSAKFVDHKNRNGLDNRKSNLRKCTAAESARNMVKKRSKSGYLGVYQNSGRAKTWKMNIRFNNKFIREHGFETAEAAARRYDELSRELHGEFGIRNFPDEDQL